LALLITWVVTSGGGGGGGDGRKTAHEPEGKNPAASITPGPSSSGPAISEAPGGRDESAKGGDTSGSGSDDESRGGSGDSTGGSGTSGGSGGIGSGSGGSGGTSAVWSGEQVPAGSRLPDCTATAVKLVVRSVKNEYEPGDKPAFELVASNSSDSDCKVDLGSKSSVLTITQARGDHEIWSTADCPESAASLLFRVPAEGRVTYTVEWNRKPSARNCTTPSGDSAPAGTYLVEAKASGLRKAQTSFVLAKD
jgi:hypothetical protein